MVTKSSKQNGSDQDRQRQALVIGVNKYLGQELNNAVGDATRVAGALEKRSFVTTVVKDATKEQIDAALEKFKLMAQKAEQAVIFLAGHAVERHGSGYFLPADFEFPLQPASVPYTGLSLNAFVEATEGAASRIVVLDACRNWPQDPEEARRSSNDLDELISSERDWQNLLLAYSTSATREAGDGTPGSGSTFANSMCEHLLNHNLTVDECFRRVSQDVLRHERRQQAWTYSSLAETLSFSDLPRFSAIQRHAVPNPNSEGVYAWSTIDVEDRGVIVGLDNQSAWRVRITGLEMVFSTGNDDLTGAVAIDKHLLLSGLEGALYQAGAGSKPILDLNLQSVNGLSANAAGTNFVYYGADTVYCFEVISGTINSTAQYDLGFEVYFCVCMPDGSVWAAGANGKICELDPINPTSKVRDIAQFSYPLNAMAVTSTGENIFIVGQHGLAVEIDQHRQEVAQLLPDRRLKTAAGIRNRLVPFADDDSIYRFIFDQTKLEPNVRDELDEVIGFPNYPACAIAPNLPILAISTDESSVILIDTRDRQVFQELDVGSGYSSMVTGVHFLSDKELVVIGGRGDVTFFSA